MTKRDQNKRLILVSFVSIVSSLLCVSTFGVMVTMLIRPGVSQASQNQIYNEMNSSERNQDIRLLIKSQSDAIHDVFMYEYSLAPFL